MSSYQEQSGHHRSWQIGTLIFAILFWIIIFGGYFLFLHRNFFLAVPIALLVATGAVVLAKLIGSAENGFRRYWFAFALLLAVSAMGVYNSLMLNSDGPDIVSESITEAATDFANLRNAANSQLAQSGVTERRQRVETTADALLREIDNPLNCGQGPEAARLIARLQKDLPGFTPLSSTGVDCSRNSEVIEDYRQRIESLIDRANWNNPAIISVAEGAERSRRDLQALEAEAGEKNALTLLSSVAPKLEEFGVQYRNYYETLSQNGSVPDQVNPALNLTAVRSLGEPMKLINLIFERIDRPTTWVYLMFALLLDTIMVLLFREVRRTRPNPGGPTLRGTGPGRAFQ